MRSGGGHAAPGAKGATLRGKSARVLEEQGMSAPLGRAGDRQAWGAWLQTSVFVGEGQGQELDKDGWAKRGRTGPHRQLGEPGAWKPHYPAGWWGALGGKARRTCRLEAGKPDNISPYKRNTLHLHSRDRLTDTQRKTAVGKHRERQTS